MDLGSKTTTDNKVCDKGFWKKQLNLNSNKRFMKTLSDKSSRRIRATIDYDGVGKRRHDIYASVMERVKEATEKGFYLEAITLLESIISDRLESFCNEQNNSNEYAFSCMGKLITEAKKHIISSTWLNTLDELHKWKENRNDVLHQMAKIEQGDQSTFCERYQPCSGYAKQGVSLFNKINGDIRRYRRSISTKQV